MHIFGFTIWLVKNEKDNINNGDDGADERWDGLGTASCVS